jgi:hypothetical protein
MNKKAKRNEDEKNKRKLRKLAKTGVKGRGAEDLIATYDGASDDEKYVEDNYFNFSYGDLPPPNQYPAVQIRPPRNNTSRQAAEEVDTCLSQSNEEKHYTRSFMQNPSMEDHLKRAGVTNIAKLVEYWKGPEVEFTTWDDVMNIHKENKADFDKLIEGCSFKSQNMLKLYVRCYDEAVRLWNPKLEYNDCFSWLTSNINDYQYYISDNYSCRFLQFCSDSSRGKLLTIAPSSLFFTIYVSTET